MIFPTLRTDRLLLREIVDDDLPHIFHGLSHPDVIRYYGIQYDTLETAKTQMTWYADLVQSGTGIWWAITPQSNQHFYGTIGVNNLRQDEKSAEIGFWLLPDYWGNRFIPEAVPAVCQYAFQQLELQRIIGLVETENIKSKKTFERLHFVHESVRKDCEVKNGIPISLDVYVMDKTRFENAWPME